MPVNSTSSMLDRPPVSLIISIPGSMKEKSCAGGPEVIGMTNLDCGGGRSHLVDEQHARHDLRLTLFPPLRHLPGITTSLNCTRQPCSSTEDMMSFRGNMRFEARPSQYSSAADAVAVPALEACPAAVRHCDGKTRRGFSMFWGGPAAHLGIDLLPDLVPDLAGVARKQRQEALQRNGVQDAR